ncbi:hypothetical protein CC1G_07140 [Coprinopsis cinerea okayama7|uniref:BTB domain-containing protein n=1 Tax=Coprinopsis cinerea (strain Okayama-7 / 130 / ATCC MYA-4618 / FGSC 9003) TaxID=240176 RepID=A8NR77_COPC7|nr:hypothetical protein CC1G_07140 [Coprinopsis cinerea okayama7\|eukprot:XP_001835716.1 hypothetical protein CC1G_07140 [Coprinopsis cinerea okayama7\
MANGLSILGSTEDSKLRSLYWFEDATLILIIGDAHFRVHHPLISRHSNIFKTLPLPLNPQTVVLTAGNSNGALKNDTSSLIVQELVAARDFEILLAHLYHDEPLTQKSDLARVSAILRVSSPCQLDFPHLHTLAKNIFEQLVPADPLRLDPRIHSPYETLELASRHRLNSIRKSVLYWVVTTHHFEEGDTLEDQSSNVDLKRSRVTETDKKICEDLLGRIIEHFTPILYTPATGSHMPCTDRFADLWMPYVIQPSLENDGVYKPLETLERIKSIDWEKEGLCPECVAEKREEWTEEQKTAWEKIEQWIDSHQDD